MTVANLKPAIIYLEDGVTVNFSAPFRFAAGSIRVSRVLASGQVVQLTAGVDFSVTGGETDAGGTVTLNASIAGARLRIRRSTARTQAMDYTTNDRFPAESHEGAIDRAMLIDQEQDAALDELDGRAIKVPDGETAPALAPAPTRGGRYLAFDVDGNIIYPTGQAPPDQLSLPGGAELIGTPDGSVQEALNARPTSDALYAETVPGRVRLGRDGSGNQAIVQIGSSTYLNTGGSTLRLGGTGPKDGPDGLDLGMDSGSNWMAIRPSKARNPIELALYSRADAGTAISTGTTTLTRSTGPAWTADMVGNHIWFRGIAYTVNSFVDASTLILASSPPADTQTWHYFYTTGSGTCTVTGGVVTRVAGDPFIPPGFGDGFRFTLNGVAYTVISGTPPDSYTVSSPPANGTYTYGYQTNINDQLSTFRIPSRWGSSEQTWAFYSTPYAYIIEAQGAGPGTRLLPFWLCSNYQPVVEMHPTEKLVVLGGSYGDGESLRVPYVPGGINYMVASGSISGNRVGLAARGQDSNVGVFIDVKGQDVVQFSAGSFARTTFRIVDTGGADRLEVSNTTNMPTLIADGASANTDIRLSPKGTGRVRFGTWTSSGDAAVNGYIEVKDFAGNIRKLATIA
ncbi:MAG: hypothetical protein QHC65_04275 [Sphingomonas sp.]|nr:hypothetical protein [Sphingomonas sp.]MDX3883615.1 hypothetical protein [Sphingomonas sp.]